MSMLERKSIIKTLLASILTDENRKETDVDRKLTERKNQDTETEIISLR